MASGLFHATFIIYRTTPSLSAPSSTTGTLCKVFFFLLLAHLAAAFSTTSLTELEQNYSSGLEFIRGNSEVFFFILFKYSFR